jgi:cytoskeletal protein RodZ
MMSESESESDSESEQESSSDEDSSSSSSSGSSSDFETGGARSTRNSAKEMTLDELMRANGLVEEAEYTTWNKGKLHDLLWTHGWKTAGSTKELLERVLDLSTKKKRQMARKYHMRQST